MNETKPIIDSVEALETELKRFKRRSNSFRRLHPGTG